VYSGYELYEHVAVRPGSEEYLDSEKYQIRVRDWDGAAAEGRTLAPYIKGLNQVRRQHPALQLLRNVTIHSADDENVLVFSKRAGDDIVVVVINLDPHGTRETTVHLNMPALGLGWHDSITVYDEITEQTWSWKEHNYVRLDPGHEPAHILSVRKP
jgi:starch synthase (maltosyl-transferring)